ncbi:glucose-methanol-choline (gmc) oxidoreductase [Penicillium alfredii]|uniref:Glucose-methanol-choline (Gmc) oxidoreductase n=1 Tax=Penicillium alfredii TaxID=1506179 RepID=A0A9W9ESB7_9EURO|nr:glucose-methanol-choline (gmc) oxidoreductase [Penicillium alfredii]KAJ5086966.1 glucose-methanol-choline (gmc) oxidoreductase [Penicillium alfredii]
MSATLPSSVDYAINPNGWYALTGSELDWQLETLPQPGLNNRSQDHSAGKVLGGCSAINGLIFVPPSPAGIDARAKLGNPEWNWASLRPYLQKSYTLSPSGQPGSGSGGGGGQEADRRNSTINGPIQLTTRPYAATVDPISGLPSSAEGEYGTVASSRPNVTIVTDVTVHRILFDSGSGNISATGVEVEWNGSTATLKAAKEVILAAGAFHTPKLLEISGVGAKDRLSALGIPVVLDHTGVGENLQNHVMGILPVPLASFEKVIQSINQSSDEASAFLLLSTAPGNNAVLAIIPSYPFSRGSTHISSADADVKPTIDPRFFAHDLDLEILARHTQNLYRLISAPARQDFLHSESAPPDLDTIRMRLCESMAFTTHHSCGTTSMLPREAGGVVDQEL